MHYIVLCVPPEPLCNSLPIVPFAKGTIGKLFMLSCIKFRWPSVTLVPSSRSPGTVPTPAMVPMAPTSATPTPPARRVAPSTTSCQRPLGSLLLPACQAGCHPATGEDAPARARVESLA
jgi:hypothetical protein